MNRLEIIDQQNFSLLSFAGKAGKIALTIATAGGIVWLGAWLAKKEAERIAAMEKHIINYRKKHKNCSIVDISNEYGYDIDTISRVLTFNDLTNSKDEKFMRSLRNYNQIEADKLELEKLRSEIEKNHQTSDSIQLNRSKQKANLSYRERDQYADDLIWNSVKRSSY